MGYGSLRALATPRGKSLVTQQKKCNMKSGRKQQESKKKEKQKKKKRASDP
jgi:hypothetical protein